MNTFMFAANHVTNVLIISLDFLVSPPFRGKHFTTSVIGTNKQPSAYAPKCAYFVCDGDGGGDDNANDHDDDDVDAGAAAEIDAMSEVVVHVVVGMMIYYHTYYMYCVFADGQITPLDITLDITRSPELLMQCCS